MNWQEQATRRLEPAPERPPSGTGPGLRWVVGALGVLLVGAVAALAVVLLSGGEQDADERVVQIAASVERPLERLDDAAQQATPRDRASLVTLRAAAERTIEELDDADDEIGRLDPDLQQQAAMQELEDALDASRQLAEVLAAPKLSTSEIQGLAAEAKATAEDQSVGKLTVVDSAVLVNALRRDRRLAARRRRNAAEEQSPTPPTSPPSAETATLPSFRQHAAFGYQAQIPTGGGWSEPADSQPTPGRLFRTSVRGPAGMFVIIDYTPLEPAVFGGSYQSRRDVGQTAFGQATEYVFQGGRLPECQRAPCVDYIINDPASDSGFAVLAGGTDFEPATEIARTVMESLVPQSYGE